MDSHVMCACLLFLMTGNDAESKRVNGIITTSSDWHFITRFCFLSQKGSLRYTFEYPKSYGTQSILLYYDQANQWDNVYESSMTCDEKVSTLDPINNQVITLSVLYSWSGCVDIVLNGVGYIRCEGGRVFRSTRETWWFIVVSRCDQSRGPTGVNLSYNLHMTNGKEGDMVHREFSADEFYILPVDIAFIGIYILLLVGASVCAAILRARQLFHTTYKMYIAAIGIYLLYLLFACIANGIYSESGYEQFGLKIMGRSMCALSELVFLLMLILVGKGLTITRGRLSTSSSVKVAVFFILYTITYIALFIYEAEEFDPAKVLYTYESPAGYGLISLRLIGWMWFCYSVFFTVKHYKTKSVFYFPLVVFYSAWFWAQPIVVLLAMFAVDQWIREKAVHSVELFVTLCGHILFQVLTRPRAANENFPYHVRTTQIACMMATNSRELDNFNNHAYDIDNHLPGAFGPDLTALFATSKTNKESEMDKVHHGACARHTGLPPSYSTAQLFDEPGKGASRRESTRGDMYDNSNTSTHAQANHGSFFAISEWAPSHSTARPLTS